ncbi:MAG: FliA/WhiG family RNA polymerase sigma factor [Thermodesulfovibrionales bacterium]
MTGYKKELSEEEKEQIINDFLPFIKYNAYRLAWRLPPQLTVEDLISVGIIGLLDALNRYKKNKAKISTFVEYRIKGAMLDEIRSHYRLPKSIKKKMASIENAYLEVEREKGQAPEPEEIAERLNISLDEYYKILQKSYAGITLRFEDLKKSCDEESPPLEENIIDPDMKTPLEIYEDNVRKELLAGLIDKLPEREKLILSLYYWDGLTMKEIGKILNITEGRICQLHNQALMRLKSSLELSPIG